MARSRYVKTGQEIKEYLSIYANPKFYDVDTLLFLYETKPEVIAAMLPPPLQPVDPPIVTVQIVLAARSNCVAAFDGCGVWISCRYNELPGAHCVHMVMNTDQAIIFGRELMGEPKKYGKPSLVRQGDRVEARVERFGKEYLTIHGDLSGPANIDEMPKDSDVFYFKFLPACNGSGLEFDPILLKAHFKTHYNSLEQGLGNITYLPSDHDFLYELECINPVGLFYGNVNLDANSERIATIPANDFLPYAFGKMDDWRLLNNMV
ncbi:MAG: acetoacetate decarboxylase family protein [Syntrophobacteraceae bacterium]